MSARLIRALQRGGCAAEASDTHWSVWRASDRRGRAIGELSTADVELLRLNGDLSLLGGTDDGRLVWTGRVDSLAGRAISAMALVKEPEGKKHHARPLLHRILAGRASPSERRSLARAARDFAEDVECSENSYSTRGMNWNAISAGTRIDGGQQGAPNQRAGYATDAAIRMQRLNRHLTGEDMRFLWRLIIERDTRYAIAQWLSVSPSQSEVRGRRVLRDLAASYETKIKRPERAS